MRWTCRLVVALALWGVGAGGCEESGRDTAPETSGPPYVPEGEALCAGVQAAVPCTPAGEVLVWTGAQEPLVAHVETDAVFVLGKTDARGPLDAQPLRFARITRAGVEDEADLGVFDDPKAVWNGNGFDIVDGPRDEPSRWRRIGPDGTVEASGVLAMECLNLVHTHDATVCVGYAAAVSPRGIAFRIVHRDGSLGPERVFCEADWMGAEHVDAGYDAIACQSWFTRYGGISSAIMAVDLDGARVTGPGCPVRSSSWQTCGVDGSASLWAGVGPVVGDETVTVPDGEATVSLTAFQTVVALSDVAGEAEGGLVVVDDAYAPTDSPVISGGGAGTSHPAVVVEDDEATVLSWGMHLVPGPGGPADEPTIDSGMWLRSAVADGLVGDAVRMPEEDGWASSYQIVDRSGSAVIVAGYRYRPVESPTERETLVWLGCCTEEGL